MYRVTPRKTNRDRRKAKIRSNLSGSASRPRVSVYRSNKYIYAQAIDDAKGATIASIKDAKNVKNAFEAGKTFAQILKDKKIKEVVFDRNGYIYHGQVKSFADGIREGGIIL